MTPKQRLALLFARIHFDQAQDPMVSPSEWVKVNHYQVALAWIATYRKEGGNFIE